MSNIDIDDDRRRALDKFAEAPALPAAPTIAPMTAGADRVFGAQKVAVYRDDARVLQRLATLGAAAGDDWFYRYPVKNRKENRTDWIEGASIKLANDVARIYGNCEVDTRVFDLGDHWMIYARFTDFETGFALTRPFQQRKSAGKIGGEGSDADARRLDISFQIGVSKAIRNVVVNALQTYADYAFDAARNSLVDRIGKDIEAWRKRTLEGLGKIPVDPKRAERVIGKPAKDWLAPDVARIIAMMKAIADGMASPDETFPPIDGTATGELETGDDNQPSTQDAAAAASDPVADQPDSPQSSSQPTSHGTAATSTEAESGKATTKTEAKNTEKKTGDDKPKDDPPKEPKTEKEYVAYADKWRAAATDPVAAMQRWKDEKTLRNKCNVGPDTRDSLLAKLQQRCADLQAQEG